MADLSEANMPKRARELFDKGLVATEHGNLPYAMDMFMAVLDIEPHFLRARKFLRASALKQFNEAGGGQVTRVMATIGAAPQLIKGWLALRAGKSQEALRLGEELLRKDPLNPTFIRFLCKTAEAAEMPEVAALTLAMVREYFQQDAEFLAWLGKLYMQMDQPQEAKECFEAVINLKPHDTEAMQALKNAMARETMAKGGWDDAAKGDGGYRSVIKDVKEASLLEKEAMAVKDSKSAELLIHDLEERVKHEPENVNYRRALANLYMQATRFDDAKHTIDEAKRLGNASDPQLDQMLATVQLKQFDFEIAQCRENGDLAGVKTKESTKKEFVFKNTEARIERYPNDLPLRYDYGVLLFERDMLNESIQQFQMAQRNPRNRVRSLYYMARCFKQKQQFDMAREQLEKAAAELTEMDDLKKDIFYQLGETLEAQGDIATAVNQYYKEIYQVDIGYKDVAAKIEKSYKPPPQA